MAAFFLTMEKASHASVAFLHNDDERLVWRPTPEGAHPMNEREARDLLGCLQESTVNPSLVYKMVDDIELNRLRQKRGQEAGKV